VRRRASYISRGLHFMQGIIDSIDSYTFFSAKNKTFLPTAMNFETAETNRARARERRKTQREEERNIFMDPCVELELMPFVAFFKIPFKIEF
jgi:hypothetical protein